MADILGNGPINPLQSPPVHIREILDITTDEGHAQMTDTPTAPAATPPVLTFIGTDPFTTPPPDEHATEVEPQVARGKNAQGVETLVAAYQVGRNPNGGATGAGVSASSDGGQTWREVMLPGLTKATIPPGQWDRVSDLSVTWCEKSKLWVATSLAIAESNGQATGRAVMQNRSADGITWDNAAPVATAPSLSFYDKNWTVADNNPNSPHYGRIYTVFDDNGQGDLTLLTFSDDGGTTWSTPVATQDQFAGLGGQPRVQADGTLIIPLMSADGSGIWCTTSKDGGVTLGSAVAVSSISAKPNAANIRTSPLPSAAIGADGRIYVVWQDSRFESGGSANDIVLASTTDGTTFSNVMRIPMDGLNAGIDHFIPAIGADPSRPGHISVACYFSSNTNPSQVFWGEVSSADGGTTWSPKVQLAGPFDANWGPATSQGIMLAGDYTGNDITDDGMAHPVGSVAGPPVNGKLNVRMATAQGGVQVTGGNIRAEIGRRGIGGLFGPPVDWRKVVGKGGEGPAITRAARSPRGVSSGDPLGL